MLVGKTESQDQHARVLLELIYNRQGRTPTTQEARSSNAGKSLAIAMFAKRYQRPAFKVLIFHHHEKGLKLPAPAADNSMLPHQATSSTDHAHSYLELLLWIT